MISGQLALTTAALFTGAAFYINFAEQPARLTLDDRSQLAQWKPAYARGYLMQATLAICGFILGLAAAWQTGKTAFVVGGLLMIANWPWTPIGIMPTNKILMAPKLHDAGAQTRALLGRWNKRHGVRTALGALATVAFLIALSSS